MSSVPEEIMHSGQMILFFPVYFNDWLSLDAVFKSMMRREDTYLLICMALSSITFYVL